MLITNEKLEIIAEKCNLKQDTTHSSEWQKVKKD